MFKSMLRVRMVTYLIFKILNRYADTIIMEDGKLELAEFSATNTSTLEHMVFISLFLNFKLYI